MAELIHVVEDDEDIRFIVEYVLAEAGYEVLTSGSAKDFYEKVSIAVTAVFFVCNFALSK